MTTTASSRTAALSALAAALWLAGAVPGRSQVQTPQVPRFRAGIDIVQIDVTVLDADGKPVHGLLREDFTLLEDGEPQEILGFGEVNIPDASDGPAWLHDASPDVRTAMDGRVFVFLLDDAQTPYRLETKSWIDSVKRITNEVIDQLGPTDVAAVLCTYDNRCDQDFTNDRIRLRAAIAKFNPKDAFIAYRVSAGMAQSVARYLREQPGRRKSIIYVTPRMPTRPAEWPPTVGDLGTSVTQQQMIRTFEEAMRARVTVYGISPAGIRMLVGENENDNPFAPGVFEPPDEMHLTAPPRSLSLETGGFNINRPDELVQGVAQIFRETGSYYLLGYEQPKKKDTGYNMLGGFRAIEVRVNRPDLQIKTHRGYIVAKPDKPPSKPVSPATSALSGILPKADLPLRVSLAPIVVVGPSGKPETAVAIVLGVQEPEESSRSIDRLELQFRAFTQRGEERSRKIQTIDLVIPRGRDEKAWTEVLGELRVKPGVYAVRLSASSERLGVEGSVYADVEVPDFAKAPLSLSGVLLTSVPRPTVVPIGDFNDVMPVEPTTLREFSIGHRVSAFLRVYQGGKTTVVPVTMTARVLNPASAVVAESSEMLEASRFETERAADFEYRLPLAQLSPGLHLLRLEATAGAAVIRRDVRFAVR